MVKDIGWEFPSTNGGKEDGLNDSGISYFQANPIKSLTREVIQDSLDARISEDIAVNVQFELRFLDKEAIPGIKDLIVIFNQAANYYKEGSADTYEFFKSGHEILKKEKIPVFAIRDRNTTGLTRVNQQNNSHFHRLTKTTGDTAKTGTSNGSFGIGKHAPFAASSLRAMFYGTLNREEENNKGFQGVIKIASFDRGETFPTQGTGFYGYKDGFKPLTMLSGINSFFRRKDGDFGTDKFILGFSGSENWENIVMEEVVNSYMCAILDGSLEVQVGSIIIDKNSIASVIEKIKQFNPESLCIEYYLSLSSKDSIVEVGNFKTEDGQVETMKLYLLLGENFHNKVSLVRGTGMKIYNKDRFKAPFRFAGTLVVEGENLNKVLRKMEPPTHDNWDPELYKKNIKYAKKLKKDLYKWLNDMVREIAPKSEQNSFELPGLENILPSLSQDEESTHEVDLNVRDEKINSIVIVNNQMNSPKKTVKRTKTTPKTKRNPKPKPPISKETKVRLRSTRAFCYDPHKGLYRVILNPSNSGTIFLEVNLVGESVTEKAIIHAAKNDQSGAAITIEKNILGPIEVSKSATSTLTLLLDNLTRYSLEVSTR